MAETTCPYCGAKLFPHELRNGECSSCMRRLPGNVTAEAAPEPEWRGGRDPQPQPQRQERRDPYGEPVVRGGGPYDPYDRPVGGDYGAVRVGVNLLRWGMGISLLLVGLFYGLLFAVMGAGMRGGADFQPIAIMLGLGVLGSALVAFVGLCFCCAVPGGSQGAGWSRGLIVFLVLSVLMVLGTIVLASGGPRMLRELGDGDDMVLPFLFLGGCVVVSFGTQLCLLMALRGVARDFGDYALGGGFVAFLVTNVVIQILGVGVQVYIQYLREEAFAQAFAGPGMGMQGGGMQGAMLSLQDIQNITMATGCVMLVVLLGMFIWFLTLLSRVANLIPVGGYGGRRYPPPYRGGPY